MNASVTDDTIVAEIAIKAPAERVFDALTDPAARVKWWGLKGRFETKDMESDLRVGGRWEMRGIGMGGGPFRVSGQYRSIERPRLLAFTWRPSWDEAAADTLVRFDLAEKDGVTTVRLTHSGFKSADSSARHQGWPQILGWLQGYCES